MTAQDILDDAIAAGYDRLSDRDLLLCLLEGVITGGGGGSCVNVTGAGTDPTGVVTPAFTGQVYVSTTDYSVWQAGSTDPGSWTLLVDGIIFDPATTDVPDLEFSGMSGIASVYFSNLTTADNNINFNSMPDLVRFSSPTLANANGDLTLYSCPSLTTVSLPALVSVGGNFYIYSSPITSLDLSSLQQVSGDMNLTNIEIANLVFPALSQVNSFSVGNDSASTIRAKTLSCPVMTDITGDLDLLQSPELVSASFPLLDNVEGNMHCEACPLFTTFSAPNLILTNDDQLVDFHSDALTATSINQILARCVASGLTSSNINLSGGTNAAPTGQGIIDKAALITAGNSVTTN